MKSAMDKFNKIYSQIIAESRCCGKKCGKKSLIKEEDDALTNPDFVALKEAVKKWISQADCGEPEFSEYEEDGKLIVSYTWTADTDPIRGDDYDNILEAAKIMLGKEGFADSVSVEWKYDEDNQDCLDFSMELK